MKRALETFGWIISAAAVLVIGYCIITVTMYAMGH